MAKKKDIYIEREREGERKFCLIRFVSQIYPILYS